MTIHRIPRLSVPSLLLLVVLAGFCVSQTMAWHRLATLSPAVVATVDIEKVFASLNAKTAADKEISAIAQRFDAECKDMENSVRNLQEELESYARGSDKYKVAEDQYMRAAFDYSAKVEACKVKLEAQRARTLKRLYESIKASSAQLARTNGYDIVLVDDSLADFPLSTEEEVTRQISARRMLYGNVSIDVTNELVNEMNTQ